MTECWLPAPGYEGFYDVSDHGNVRGCRRTVGARDGGTKVIKSKPMKLTAMKSGHLSVEFQRETTRKRFLVHRVVLTVFVGYAPQGTEGCHRNGVPYDNRLENLYWGTRSENMFDTVRHGTNYWSSRTHCKRGHEFTPENTQPRRTGSGRECIACRHIWKRESSAKRSAIRAAVRQQKQLEKSA